MASIFKRRANNSARQPTTDKQSSATKLLLRELPTLHSLPETSKGQLQLLENGEENNLFKLKLKVSPKDGFWSGGHFNFSIDVPTTYPFDPPKVLCITKVYHPNINEEGKVCLNILREDFNPTIHLLEVCNGLLFLFKNPNPEDPLNSVAAQEMINDVELFKRNVRKSLQTQN